MTLIRDFAQNIKSDGDLVISGNIGLAETPSDFGAGYALRVGNATKGGSVVLRSHADGNSGLLHFIHKDGAAAMQLGTSTDTAPSPDEIYGYIYNYNHDFRIQGDNGTHLVVDGSGNVDVSGTVTADTFEVDDTDDIRLRFLNASTFKAGLQVATTAGDMIATSAVDDLAIRSQSDILFATGGNTERLRIDSSGNVGIGINPTNPLTVLGTGGNTLTASKGVVVDYQSSNVSNIVPIGFSWSNSISNQNPYWGMAFIPTNFSSGVGDLGFYTGNVERMRIDSAGNLIFLGTGGTTTNSIDISYNGTSGQGSFYVDSDSGDTFLSFGTSSSGSLAEAMRINSSRDVTFNSYIESGDEITVTGSRILAGRYSSGHIATWGGQRSSGGPMMGYGVWPATTGSGADFVSSSGLALQRSAFILNGNVFQWWSADTSTTTLDSSVTLDLEMELGRTGLLLNDGTKLLVGGSNVTPLAGTQVYIKKQDASTNLQRWGEGDANDQNSYRFRIDQDFKFIANDGTTTDYGLAANGDTVEVNSSTGIIKFKNGGGLDFNVAQSTRSGVTPSSATLDDYEEGTWTPTLRGSGAAGSYTYTSGFGRYTKVGNLVTLSCSLDNITEVSAGTGYLQITGVPFAKVSSHRPPGSSRVESATNMTGFDYAVSEFVSSSQTDVLYIRVCALGGAGRDLQIADLVSGTTDISLSITYEA